MIVQSDFHPPRWLANPHLQTLWPVLFRRRPKLRLRRERLELPDGDFLDLDWTEQRDGPLVVVFHGLEGSVRSHYANAILRALVHAGMSGVLMHFRGCSGEPNRLPRSYNMGETGDIDHVTRRLAARHPDRPLYAVGYSLGGNALLKWLGETGDDTPLAAAVAVSVPFDLFHAARRLDSGAARIYQWHLMDKLRQSVARKQALRDLNHHLPPLRSLRNFTQFDDAVTAPLHGYRDVNDYYTRAVCTPRLAGIRRPTLIVHASDDPFMYPDSVPGPERLAPDVTLELAAHGGHVGFVERPFQLRGPWWLERRILRFLSEQASA